MAPLHPPENPLSSGYTAGRRPRTMRPVHDLIRPAERKSMATPAQTLRRPAAPSARWALAAPALLAAPLFLLTAVLLTVTNSQALRAWGWTAGDAGGVPWRAAWPCCRTDGCKPRPSPAWASC